MGLGSAAAEEEFFRPLANSVGIRVLLQLVSRFTAVNVHHFTVADQSAWMMRSANPMC